MRAALLGVLLCAALVTAGEVRAKEGSSVVVVSPPHAGPLVEEAVIRLSAELRAAGFSVRLVEGSPGGDGRAQVEGELSGAGAGPTMGLRPAEPGSAPNPGEPFATIAIVTTGRGAVADMWVADHVTKKTLVRRVDIGDAGATNAASDLAVRSVELLRASLLEVGAASKTALPADLRGWIGEPKAAPPPPPRWVASLEAAFAVLGGGGSFGIAPLPLLRIGYELPRGISLRASVAPAVMPATRGFPAGTVALQQTVAALDLAYSFGLERQALYPVVSLGGGLYYLHVDGQAVVPQGSRTGGFASAVLVTGAGLGARILPNLTALADLQVVALQTEPVVTVTGSASVSAGRAALLPSVGLVAHF
jgi:hypothetical protein